MPTPQSPSASTSANSPPIETHSAESVPLQFVGHRLHRLSVRNLGQSAEELDSGVDFFQAQGLIARNKEFA